MNIVTNHSHEDDLLLEAAEWCLRLSDNDMSAAEWTDFELWSSDPANQDRLDKMAAIWQFTGGISNEPEVIGLRTAALHRYQTANQRRWRSNAMTKWIRPSAIAASLAVLAVFGASMFGSGSKVYATETGERRIASLADGSRMSLDASTQLAVSMEDDVRSIELMQGRAKFDVAHDPLRPFAVQAGDKLIVAIGTSFSVEIVDGEVRVILYTGTVEIRDRSDLTVGKPDLGSVRQVLTPGQQLIDPIESRGPGQVVTIDRQASLTWEMGMLSFRGEPLNEAVERINRYSERKVVLQGAGLDAVRVDGEFKAGDSTSFVEGVAAVHGLEVSRDGEQLGLRRR